jgi:hypothetical protein
MSALLSDVLFYIYYFIYHVLIIGHWLLVIDNQYVWNVIIYFLVFANLGRLQEAVARVFVKFKQHTLWAVDHKEIFISLFAAAHCIVFPAQRFCEFPHKPVTKSKQV